MSNSKATRVGRYLIYGLIDPRDRCLFYVGKTHKRREIRLAEHIEDAEMGETAPVYFKIREILESGYHAEVFVLKRIGPDASWQDAEMEEIHRWRNWLADSIPYIHPPQTPKSTETLIERVELTNVLDGGDGG